MKTIIFSNTFFLFLALSGCEMLTEEKTTAEATAESQVISTKVVMTEAQFKNAGIQLNQISEQQISNTLKVNGMIDVPPQNLVSISIPIGGFVKMQAEILQGTSVRKGQTLAIVENPDFIQFQQDYLDTQSKLEYASADYKRQMEMREENVNSVQVLQRATAEYKSLQTRLKSLEQYLKAIGISVNEVKKGNITNQIAIFSPIDGYVTVVNVNQGKHVSPAEVMFEITNTDHLHAELNVFEKDIPKLKAGQKVRFLLNNDDHEYKGKIYLINHKINADRTVNIHVHFDQRGTSILPKTFLTAFIETGSQPALTLPTEAFIFSEGADFVFIYLGKIQKSNEYEFEMIEVKKGITENGFTELILPPTADLKGRQVATKGAFTLMAKMKNIGEEE